MTKYLYYPGCSLRSTGKAYEESMLAVFKALDVPLEELDDWNCCGATAYASIDETAAFALAARNLALAEKQQQRTDGPIDLVAPCSACFLVLTKTQKYMSTHPELNEKVQFAIGKAGLQYEGNVRLRHPLDVLVNDIGLETIAKHVKKPLKGLSFACYYGCQVVRPFMTFDAPMYPTTMDRLVKTIGGETVDWPMKARCCGGSLMGTIQEAGLRLNRALLKEAQRYSVDAILTCCPLCQHNLECYQERINRHYGEEIHVPVLYFTQVLGLAMGLSEKELGIQRLFVQPGFNTVAQKEGSLAHA